MADKNSILKQTKNIIEKECFKENDKKILKTKIHEELKELNIKHKYNGDYIDINNVCRITLSNRISLSKLDNLILYMIKNRTPTIFIYCGKYSESYIRNIIQIRYSKFPIIKIINALLEIKCTSMPIKNRNSNNSKFLKNIDNFISKYDKIKSDDEISW